MGPLEYYERDPEYPRKKRGPGYYYLRGRLESQGGRPTYSKWSEEADIRGGSWGGSIQTLGGEKVGKGRYRHTHDLPEEVLYPYGDSADPDKLAELGIPVSRSYSDRLRFRSRKKTLMDFL